MFNNITNVINPNPDFLLGVEGGQPVLVPRGYNGSGKTGVEDLNAVETAATRSLVSGAGIAASSTSAAALNLAAVQTAIDTGIVDMRWAGNALIYINGSLVLKSGGRYNFGQVRFRAASGTNVGLVKIQAEVDFLAGIALIVTVTWSSGIGFSVAWAGHGKSAGDEFILYGATGVLDFNNVFTVDTVTDANNITAKLNKVPTGSPSGTIKAISAVQNMHMIGGDFDYDTTNNAAAADYQRHNVRFFGLGSTCVVEKVRSSNATKYAFLSEYCGRTTFRDLCVPWNNSDGLKIYGPNACLVDGLQGRAGDDGFSVQAKESSSFSAAPVNFAGGVAYGVTVRRVALKSANGSVACGVVYLSDTCMTDKILFDDVRGSATDAGAGVRVQINAADTVGLCGQLTFRDCSANGVYTLRVVDGTIAQLNYIGGGAAPATPTAQQILFGTPIIKQVNIEDLCVDVPGYPSAANNIIQLAGTLDVVNLNRCMVKNGTGASGQARMVAVSSGSIKQLNLNHCYANGDNAVMVSSGLTIAPEVNINGGCYEGAAVVGISNNCTVNLSGGVRILNASNGVVRGNATATVDLHSDGTTKLVAGSWAVQASGTLSLTVFGYDIAIDPIAQGGLLTTAGQFCYSTRASAINQGPTVRTAAGWIALGTGASGVNTVIT